MFACIHALGDVLSLALTFSPRVEQTAPDTVLLDISGLDRMFGLPQEIAAAITRRAAECGLKINIAIADNPDAAICAARKFPGTSIIPHGDEAKFLGSLPLDLLSPSPELQETLARWGIRKFRDLAALPELGIADRLGPEGLRLQKLARGAADRPLVPVEDPLRFEEELELEYPVEMLEPLSFILARLLNGICIRLLTRGLATNELRLRLNEHERALRLPVPMLDPKAFLKLLLLDLSSQPPASAVERVWMAALPVKPRAAQNGLFVPLSPEPEKLEVTLTRISSLVGERNVGSPELLDTHRPDAFQMRRFGQATAQSHAAIEACPRLALRLFRPPRRARVLVLSGQPGHILAEGVRGKVVSSAGPWRTSGDWWTEDPWARDEWDVALHDGTLYRIYCEQRGWFVEGGYD